MFDISTLDNLYNDYLRCINNNLFPDGVIDVDLDLLQTLGLLNFHRAGQYNPGVTRYFQLIESADKITLINDQFFVWVTSRQLEGESSTLALIALNKDGQPRLELAFVASGVYNTSHLVMNVLEKFLLDIQESEDVLKSLKTTST